MKENKSDEKVYIFTPFILSLFCCNHKQESNQEKIRKAAEQGLTDAQYNLGVMYDKGKGVTRNYAQAVAWYRKAAEQGIDRAQYNLGLMYYKGKGVTQDYKEAEAWYEERATYHEYNGAYGLSDQFINDVLEGDPDNYWNID